MRNQELAKRAAIILSHPAVLDRAAAEDAIKSAYGHITGLSKDADFLYHQGRYYIEFWIDIFCILGEYPLFLLKEHLINDEHLGVRTAARALSGKYMDDKHVQALDTEIINLRGTIRYAMAVRFSEVCQHHVVQASSQAWRKAVEFDKLRLYKVR